MARTTRRTFILGMTGVGALAAAGLQGSEVPEATAAPLPTVTTPPPLARSTWQATPRWRGFNLLERFDRDNPEFNRDFDIWDLDAMAEWGFDFVRVPLDYRIWTRNDGSIDDGPLKSIDALVWEANARGIHVNLNMHRAPGYRVGEDPTSELDLWGNGASGERARKQFETQWWMLSQRFNWVDETKLSFGLVNEPPDVSAAKYHEVLTPAVKAIRSLNANRVIMADGLAYGRRPVPELVDLQLVQCGRGYDPERLTHYRADWIANADTWPKPAWPLPAAPPDLLYGTWKPEFQRTLKLVGNFPAGQGSITIGKVSSEATLVINADGREVFWRRFEPGPGSGEWEYSTYSEEWNNYDAVYNRTYTFDLPSGAREVTFDLVDGDWISFYALTLGNVVVPTDERPYGTLQGTFWIGGDGSISGDRNEFLSDRGSLAWEADQWRDFASETSTAVMVGEWGVYNQTGHQVALDYMRDALGAWKDASMGWALWGLRGDFGVVDSGRSGVTYENFRGRSLDRKMLELLREF